ncbi:hypothetical protein [Schwartzia succinivorans]|uniref:hypothetical protein n=1 Tax=Schwartzia succinivorans TaxID=55507 RepID=UPI0013563DCF|nr:hypothetical protein [Schwartzia succinivorans]
MPTYPKKQSKCLKLSSQINLQKSKEKNPIFRELSSVGLISEKWILFYYNSAKNVPHFCKWGIGQIAGGEHISRLARREASALEQNADRGSFAYGKTGTKAL